MDFKDKVAIVTGGGNGLGRSYALALARLGAKVLVNDMGSAPDGSGADRSVAERVVAEIRDEGGTAEANSDSVESGDNIVASALAHFGRTDILINNAGILRDAAFHKMTDEQWDSVYRVHLLGAFKTTRAAWSHMRVQQYGRIVMTSSAAGLYGNFGQANYCAVKLGLFGFAQCLAIEGAGHGIRVNTIAPIANSRLTRTVLDPDMLTGLSPEHITPLVLWLCHEQCDATGQLFEVGGGWAAQTRFQRATGAALHSDNDIIGPVRDAWPVIRDFSSPSYPGSAIEALDPITHAAQHALSTQE